MYWEALVIVILLITHWKLALYHMTFTRIGHKTSFTMIQVLKVALSPEAWRQLWVQILEGSLGFRCLKAALGSDAIVSLRPPQTPESVFSNDSSLITVCVVWAMPDAGKLAACSRPIGSQIGDVTKWTNRRPEAQLADQSGALKLVREKGREILCDVLSPQGYSVARRWEKQISKKGPKIMFLVTK